MYVFILTFVILTYVASTRAEIKNNDLQTINETIDIQTKYIPLGRTAVLECRSNDNQHNFRFWQLPQKQIAVGPGNTFDKFKYNFEILSGKLIVKEVTTAEEGLYHCVSEGLTNNDVSIRSVRMVVNQGDNSGASYFTGVVIIACLMGGGVLCYFVQRYRKRHRLQSLLEEASDEDESGEELFSTPGTSGTSRPTVHAGKIVINKSEDQEALVEIDIPRISIDFDDDLINRH